MQELLLRDLQPIEKLASQPIGFYSHCNKIERMSPRLEKIAAIVLLIAIITSIFFAITLKPRERYTEFFILNEKSIAGDYPKNLIPGQNATIIAGIVNHEQATANYLLKVDLNNEKILEDSIEIRDGEKKMQNITFRPSATGRQKLELRLYKDSSTEPYSLHLYVDVNP